MTPGSELRGMVAVVARLDKDGSAGPAQPGDIEGEFAKNPTMDEYCRIFELNCRKRQMPFDPVMVEDLNRKYYQPRRLQMRACHPRDLIDQVVTLCRYAERKVELTPELLDLVCQSYFIDDGQPGATSAR